MAPLCPCDLTCTIDRSITARQTLLVFFRGWKCHGSGWQWPRRASFCSPVHAGYQKLGNVWCFLCGYFPEFLASNVFWGWLFSLVISKGGFTYRHFCVWRLGGEVESHFLVGYTCQGLADGGICPRFQLKVNPFFFFFLHSTLTSSRGTLPWLPQNPLKFSAEMISCNFEVKRLT